MKLGLDYLPLFQSRVESSASLAVDPLDSLGPEDTGFELLPMEPEPVVATRGLDGEGGGVAKAPCLALGPYLNREEANLALDALRQAVKEGRVVAISGDQVAGYWVIYPKARTREGALANRQMLMNRGIYESWLFDRGPLEGAISLGLYKSQDEAEAAVQGLRNRGVATKVRPRLVLGETFWIQIPWEESPLALDEAIQTLNSHDDKLKLPSPTSCP